MKSPEPVGLGWAKDIEVSMGLQAKRLQRGKRVLDKEMLAECKLSTSRATSRASICVDNARSTKRGKVILFEGGY